MKMTLREKYGFLVGVILTFGLLYVLASGGAHNDPAIGFLFPLQWLQMLIGEESFGFYDEPGLILWLELLLSTGVWLFLFFMIRGAFYYCTNLEGPSMWVAFALCLGLGFVFIALVLIPAFEQMAEWWGHWPGVRSPQLPGTQ